MFDNTIDRRDPEGTLRWAVATSGLLGTVLSFAASVVVYRTAVVLIFLVMYAFYLVFGGPAPTLPALLAPPVAAVDVVIEEDPVERDTPTGPLDEAFGLAEPDELLGAAPDPEAYRTPEPDRAELMASLLAAEIAEYDSFAIRDREADRAKVMLIGTLGSSDGGSMADIFAGSALDADELSGIGGLIGARGSELGSGGLGMRGTGSGGGGTGEGLGRLSGLGGLGTGGGGTGSVGMGTLRDRPGVATRTSALDPGRTARCTVRVDPDGDEPLTVSGCAASLHEDAKAAVRRSRRHRAAGRVTVTLTGR